MREIMRWWGIRIGVALLLGTVMFVLSGSAVLGAIVTGMVVLVVVSVAWDARRNRGNAAYGHRMRSDGAADGAPYAGVGGVGSGAGDGCGGGFDGGGGFGGGDGGGGGGC